MTNTVISKIIDTECNKMGPLVQTNGKCSPNKNSKTKIKFHGSSPITSPKGKNFYQDVGNSPKMKQFNYGPFTGGRPRCSPSKDKSPRLLSPYKEFYAGFSEPPAPASLPKPPQHWIPSSIRTSTSPSIFRASNVGLSNMKVLLDALA